MLLLQALRVALAICSICSFTALAGEDETLPVSISVTVIGGGTATVTRRGSESAVEAALAFAEVHHIGTANVPRVVAALADGVPEELKGAVVESDAFLAHKVAWEGAAAQALAVRASLARGSPLAQWRVLADALDAQAATLRASAIQACESELASSRRQNNALSSSSEKDPEKKEEEGKACAALSVLAQCPAFPAGAPLETLLGTALEVLKLSRTGNMMHPKERAIIERYLNQSTSGGGGGGAMFEYGSGASTLVFSRLARHYFSVEHDPFFCHAVKCAANLASLASSATSRGGAATVECVPGRKHSALMAAAAADTGGNATTATSSGDGGATVLPDALRESVLSPMSYAEYSKYVNTAASAATRHAHGGFQIWDDGLSTGKEVLGGGRGVFDVVLVDGMARAASALKAIPLLKPGSGVVAFHDFFVKRPANCLLCPDVASWVSVLEFFDIVEDSIVDEQHRGGGSGGRGALNPNGKDISSGGGNNAGVRRGSSQQVLGLGGSRRGSGDDNDDDDDDDDDGEYRERCPGGCDDPTSLVVLRPKRQFNGLASWEALVEASAGRAQEIVDRATR